MAVLGSKAHRCRLEIQELVPFSSRYGDAIVGSSVASPICQEGQSERTFLIFPLFPDFSWFLTIFLLSRGALCPLDPPVATPLNCGYPELSCDQNNRDSLGAYVTCIYCSLSMNINTCEAPHDAQRSWMHFCCVCFRVCVGSKNLNTPIWSSMTDDTITPGGIGSGISGLNLWQGLGTWVPKLPMLQILHKYPTWVTFAPCHSSLTLIPKWPCMARGITGKIFWGGKVIFPDFFSQREMLFSR